MSFRLVWPMPMLDRLSDQYRRAREAGLANGVTAAIHRIEQKLTADPLRCRESRNDAIRLTIDSPVAVWFEVDGALNAVTIHNVLYYRPRSQ